MINSMRGRSLAEGEKEVKCCLLFVLSTWPGHRTFKLDLHLMWEPVSLELELHQTCPLKADFITLIDSRSVTRGRKMYSSLSHICLLLTSTRPRSLQRCRP